MKNTSRTLKPAVKPGTEPNSNGMEPEFVPPPRITTNSAEGEKGSSSSPN